MLAGPISYSLLRPLTYKRDHSDLKERLNVVKEFFPLMFVDILFKIKKSLTRH